MANNGQKVIYFLFHYRIPMIVRLLVYSLQRAARLQSSFAVILLYCLFYQVSYNPGVYCPSNPEMEPENFQKCKIYKWKPKLCRIFGPKSHAPNMLRKMTHLNVN